MIQDICFYVRSALSLLRCYLIQTYWNAILFENKDYYDLSYYWHGSPYQIRILKPTPLPPSHYKVLDEIRNGEGTDLTSQMVPFMGPKFDFHGIPYCPLDFGHKTLIFYWTDQSYHEFHLKEKISFREEKK